MILISKASHIVELYTALQEKRQLQFIEVINALVRIFNYEFESANSLVTKKRLFVF